MEWFIIGEIKMFDNLTQCTLVLNRACNYRCNFCYVKGTGYTNDVFINIEDAKKIVDLCKEANMKYIVLIGGEPTLYEKLFELIEYIKSVGLTPTIVTNGFKLSEYNYCRKLIDSGVEYIDISIKGFNRDNYKDITGIDGYGKCLTAIENLHSLNANFNCSMVLTNKNIDNFCSSVSDVFSKNAKGISFCFEIYNDENLNLGVEFLKEKNPAMLINKFIKQIDKLNEITKGEWWVEYSFPLCMYTELQLKILKNKMASPCQIITETAITIDANLNLIPCSTFYKQSLGKYGKDFETYSDLKKYTNQGIYKSITEKMAALPFDDCRKCELQEKCGGGCPAYWTHFSINDLNEYKKAYYENI